MPRLEDLQKNLLDMTPEELRERIRQIREDRVIRKSKPTKTTEKKAKVKKDSIRAALDKLTPEQIIALLGGNDDN